MAEPAELAATVAAAYQHADLAVIEGALAPDVRWGDDQHPPTSSGPSPSSPSQESGP